MTNNIYCEGAKAAEIIFSLTGGREGRLMSYAPPVEILFGDVQIIEVYKSPPPYSAYYPKSPQNALELGYYHHYTSIVYELKKLAWGTSVQRENGKFYCCIFKEYVFINEYNGYPVGVVYSDEDRYFQIHEHYVYEDTKENAFVIKDMEGVLYAYKVPQGFTPTWQVNCIGCNPGECAGSDGKGGVVCMDCKQMDRDIQAIKRSLNR